MRGRDSVAAVCVLLREGLCAWEPKTSSGCCAPYLPDRGNHRRATAKPPKPVKMLWSAVRFIYLFIPPGGGNSQTVIVATQNWLWASDLHLLPPPVGNLRVEVPLRSGWTHQTSRIFEQAPQTELQQRGEGVWNWLPWSRHQTEATGKAFSLLWDLPALCIPNILRSDACGIDQ